MAKLLKTALTLTMLGGVLFAGYDYYTHRDSLCDSTLFKFIDPKCGSSQGGGTSSGSFTCNTAAGCVPSGTAFVPLTGNPVLEITGTSGNAYTARAIRGYKVVGGQRIYDFADNKNYKINRDFFQRAIGETKNGRPIDLSKVNLPKDTVFNPNNGRILDPETRLKLGLQPTRGGGIINSIANAFRGFIDKITSFIKGGKSNQPAPASGGAAPKAGGSGGASAGGSAGVRAKKPATKVKVGGSVGTTTAPRAGTKATPVAPQKALPPGNPYVTGSVKLRGIQNVTGPNGTKGITAIYEACFQQMTTYLKNTLHNQSAYNRAISLKKNIISYWNTNLNNYYNHKGVTGIDLIIASNLGVIPYYIEYTPKPLVAQISLYAFNVTTYTIKKYNLTAIDPFHAFLNFLYEKFKAPFLNPTAPIALRVPIIA